MAQMRSSVTLVCAALLVLASAGRAHADPESARHSFERGKELRDKGDCAHAIPEFEKSIAAERSIGAFYNVGFCYEQLGDRQSAYEAYRQAQQLASGKKDDRIAEISGAIGVLLEAPHIRLAFSQQLPAGLQIKVDDEVVPSGTYHAETYVFTRPGRVHNVVVSAPGYEERHETVETMALRLIELKRATHVEPTVETSTPIWSRFTTQQWVGIGLAGAGVIAEGLVVVFAIDHFHQRDALFDEIHQNNCHVEESNLVCAPGVSQETGDRLRKENDTLITDSITRGVVLGSIGGALIVTGVVLFVLGRRETNATGFNVKVAPQVGRYVQGLSIGGTF
jgi:hypothetical protein